MNNSSSIGGAAFLATSVDVEVAKGDMILDLAADPGHQQRGVERSVAMGGNVAGVEFTGPNGPSLASSAMFNRNGRGFALSAGHVGVNSNFTFFTGWDAVNNRGLEFRPVNVEVFPGYTLGMSLGSTPDVALFTFDGLVPGAPDLVFPDAPLQLEEVVTHGGFGELAVLNQAYLGRDGKARAGDGIVTTRIFINGANENGYFTTSMSSLLPGSIRGTVGSSGNPDQILKGGVLYTAGIVTQASSSVSGTTTQSVD